MATFNYVGKDGNLLDKKITAGLFTGNLGTPEVDLVNGGKSFTLRSISTSGLKPHTRGKGFNEGTVEDSKTVYSRVFPKWKLKAFQFVIRFVMKRFHFFGIM